MRRGALKAGIVSLLASAAVAIAAAPAVAAGPGLPRGYDVKRIDTPNPLGGGSFGWGVTSADVTGDGKPDLLVAQAQTGPGQIFIYNGVTGELVDTINPPDKNPNATNDETLGFVYVEVMPDIGSCAAGPTSASDRTCNQSSIGQPDGIPEIIVGARNLKVNTANGSTPPVTSDPNIGRAYVFDGATRAVLKRIDMPQADRAASVARTPPGPNGNASGSSRQFGRVETSPSALPPCAGSASEANDVGVGPCPAATQAEKVGDLNGDGQPDLLVGDRNWVDLGPTCPSVPPTTPPTPCGAAPIVASTAATGSQCASQPATSPAATCTSGKAWAYSGAQIAGTQMVPSDPHVILDGTTNPASLLYRIADPEAQTGGAEFGGGSIKRVGDITGGANATCGLTGTGNNCPDGIPEFEIAARNLDYPLKTPDASFIDAGAGFLFNGKTGLPLRTFTDPEPQPRAQFSGTFNPGRAVGDIGATSLPDVLEPAALQNAFSTDDGKAWGMNGDPNAGGGGEQSFNFATITDPFPKVGGNFGGAFTGVGNLVSGPDAPTNEVLVGGIQFDPATEASNSNIGQVHFMNVTTGKDLQDITDPDQQAGSGFGVGITPMGDLNGDGFLDFAVSAYLENLTFAAQGRAFIFTSNNAPPASQPATATSATVVGAATTISTASSGKCLNKITGSNRDDHLNGTSNGDVIFGLGGKDVINGFGGDDCLDGGSGNDRIAGGNGSDKLVGGTGADRLAGNDGDDQLFGSNGSDALDGGSGADLLAGGAGNDTLRGGAGDDTIYGEAGNDRIFAGGGNNFIDGGKGDDRIDARNGKRDTIICGPGHDSVQADRVDRVNGCERVKRPAKAKRASARRGVR